MSSTSDDSSVKEAALVAQLGELWAEDLRVLGSIPGLGMKPNKSPGCLANSRNQILSKNCGS